ncbi:hypothetical protein GCM10022600_15970 [Qipengyuania pelagi]
MRDPAPKSQMLDPVQPQETRRIHIGQVRADDQRGHGEPGLPLQPRLPDQRADKRMGEIVQRPSPSWLDRH